MKNLKIFTEDIEEKAKEQIDLLLEQDAFKKCKVRIMPDVHAGAGCVIGFTANLGKKVIPNVVGVDIGCGMAWVKTTLKEEDVDLVALDKYIRENIPSGLNVRKEPVAVFGDRVPDLKELYCYNELKNVDSWLEKSLGTLGGGNHFIEIDKDEDGFLMFVVHSGSRNLGKQVCEIYQKRAIEHCSFKQEMNEEKKDIIEKCKKAGCQKDISAHLRAVEKKYRGLTKLPKDLCYIEGEDREHYLHDMKLCQKWAVINRECILREIFRGLGLDYRFGYSIFTHTIHNYIDDNNVVRKGAISAKKDEMVLIPINMRDGCIIAKGKGNKDWNCSAPHGAGRIMSRSEARAKLSLEDYKDTMADIYTTSVCSETIDEAPMAYKPIQEIIDNIKDTVDILEIVKPIYNFKAKE